MLDIDLPIILQKISDINETLDLLKVIQRLKYNPIENIKEIQKNLKLKKDDYILEYDTLINDAVSECELLMDVLQNE